MGHVPHARRPIATLATLSAYQNNRPQSNKLTLCPACHARWATSPMYHLVTTHAGAQCIARFRAGIRHVSDGAPAFWRVRVAIGWDARL